MQSVGRININLFSKATSSNILTDEVVITDERIRHIIERRGESFYIKYKDCFPDILSDPDYIFRDKHANTAIVVKRINIDETTHINLVIRLAVEGDNIAFKNSILTAIGESDRRFERFLRKNKPIYFRFDRKE